MKTIIPVTQKALILSGSGEITHSITNSLKSFEFGVIESIENGIEALRRMSSTSYDLVICHNKIKFISGWNLIKEMKTSEKIQNMPVVLMGNMPAPASEDELKAYGLVKYLKAPASEADISFLIHSTLQLFKASGTTESKFTKAKAALIAKQAEQAVELYSELHGLTKKSLRSALGLAEAYVQKGDIDKADRILEESAKLDLENSTAVMMQIRIMIARKQFAEAQMAGLTMLRLAVDSPFVHSRILGIYADAKALEQAEHVCRDALQKNFKMPEFYNSICRIYFQKSKIEECLLTVEDTIKLFGPSVEILNIKGACLRKANLLDEALTTYAEALRVSPMDAKVYFNMAVCCIAKKSVRDAKQHLEMCLKIAPDFPNAKSKLDEVEKYLGSVA